MQKQYINLSIWRTLIMEKQVLFKSRVDIIKTAPRLTMKPDHGLDDDLCSCSPDSAELEMSQLSLSQVSSTGHSMYGLLHSTPRGTTNYNYGYTSSTTVDNDRHRKMSKFWMHRESSTVGDWKRVREQERWWTIACCTCIVVISLFIMVVLAMVLTWCIIVPRRPGVQVLDGDTSVHSLRVTKNLIPNTQILNVHLSANFTLELLVKNPNRVSTVYSLSSFSVAYKDTTVGNGSIPPFSQRPHASTQRAVNLLIRNVHVLPPNSDFLAGDAHLNDSISLQVDGHVHARLQILRISTPPVTIRLSCMITMRVKERMVSNQQCHLLKREIFAIG